MQQVTIPTTKILENLQIEALNEMQLVAAQTIEKEAHVQLISPTGTGKTLAFLIPVAALLKPELKQVQALVLVPSRELALQIDEVFRKMGTGLKVTCCYGGHKREIEEINLVQPPAIIIGTAGRIADHIRRNNFSTELIETLVLDEFDKSLELGFQEEMAFIIGSLPAVKRRILTSATPAVEIPAFVGFSAPVQLDYSNKTLIEKTVYEELVTMYLRSTDKDKADALFDLLCYVNNKSVIVFCNHRESVERCSQLLKDRGIVNVFYHGGMEQYEREAAMCKFKNGTSNVLVTTDLASRGIDFPAIKYVVHYHLPPTEEVYTHRNGRTARMENGGKVVLILSEEETVPTYVTGEITELTLPGHLEQPENPAWTTLFIAAGKKDKVNKIDVVGFLSHVGNLKKEDIGLIDVKDFSSFVAIRKLKANTVLELIKDQKIKNKKVKIDIAR